jgi:hypothetical protein
VSIALAALFQSSPQNFPFHVLLLEGKSDARMTHELLWR